MILNLQFVNHLLRVWNQRCNNPFGLRTLGLRVDLASQRDDTILDRVFYTLVKPMSDENSIQVFLDTLVQIRVHRLGVTFGTRRNYCNLIRYNLSVRDRHS